MAQTPIGSATSYVSATNSSNYVDLRQIADTLLDNGSRATSAQLIASTTWAALLLSASGEIDMAAIRGKRYEPTDLQALAASTYAGSYVLQKMCAWLAFSNAWIRRRPADQIPALGVWAYGLLDALGNGERIFPFQEAMDADVAGVGFETPEDWAKIALASQISIRYWGKRSRYYMPSSGGSGYNGGWGCGDC